MGYCYDAATGRLCCDVCSEHTGVRRVRCPFGYCQPVALCPACRKKYAAKNTKAYHRDTLGCERGHNTLVEHDRKVEELLSSGQAVRCSALGVDDDRVHVLFRVADGTYVGFYMPTETYHAIDLGTPATPDDYRKHGELVAAPSDFYGKS